MCAAHSRAMEINRSHGAGRLGSLLLDVLRDRRVCLCSAVFVLKRKNIKFFIIRAETIKEFLLLD